MELDEKLQKINLKLRKTLCNKNNIVIRGGGIHTEKLLSLTCILEYWDKISIVDKHPYGMIGNKVIKGINEIQWGGVDAVIISSLVYQQDMENELHLNSDFKGEIIKLYEEGEVSQFFELQKASDYLALERTETWEIALEKSGSGYSAEDIIQFDYKEFIKHKNNSGKIIGRHFYDVLFYMLKTVIQLQKKEINILDVGGGFGSVFLDLKYYLKNLDIKFNWTIVEQEEIVKQALQWNDLDVSFKSELDGMIGKKQFDFVLFGSCLQYIGNYQEIIQKALMFEPYRIAILKTPVSDETFFAIQHTNPLGNHNCYIADYPCRVFKEEELISIFNDKYSLEDVEEDEYNNRNNYLEYHVVKWKDFFFEKIN